MGTREGLKRGSNSTLRERERQFLLFLIIKVSSKILVTVNILEICWYIQLVFWVVRNVRIYCTVLYARMVNTGYTGWHSTVFKILNCTTLYFYKRARNWSEKIGLRDLLRFSSNPSILLCSILPLTTNGIPIVWLIILMKIWLVKSLKTKVTPWS